MRFKLEPPKISWRGDVPLSTDFDDLYYSDNDGYAESVFVFLNGAQVLESAAKKTKFAIGETGFGTGLNFLATWDAWQKKKPGSRLTFITTEAFPMRAADMEKAHKAFPALLPLSKKLLSVWPPAAAGTHVCHFDEGNVTLMLMFGDAGEKFQNLHAKIDAWYLDGFAPAKNPAMWTDNLFQRMAELSNDGATLATFTAAGFVRRGLEAHGFEMTKHPGFGLKRERVVGTYKPSKDDKLNKPISWAAIPNSNIDKIAIIGDGIAGASVAYSLVQRGLSPILVAPAKDEMKTSNLPAAILAPQLILEDTAEKSFFYAAFSYAVSHPAYQNTFGKQRGTKYTPTSPEEIEKHNGILQSFNWTSDWLTSNDEGLILPQGGTVVPSKILEKLTQNIKRVQKTVSTVEHCSGGWRLIDNNGDTILRAPTVVIAAGAKTMNLLTASGLAGASNTNKHPAIRLRAGQLECIPAQSVTNIDDYTTTYGGYVSSSISSSNGEKIRTIGSTFDKISNLPSSPISPIEQARQTNLDQCRTHTNANIDLTANITSWTGVRATTPDHMPYAGPVPDWNDVRKACSNMAFDRKLPLTRAPQMQTGMYCLTGLGSKGFQYGPLLGEYLAAMISNDPSPIPTELHAKLHPARGFVRDIIRGDGTVLP